MAKGIYLADINEEGLLLLRKKDIWILPGGKLKDGESDRDCLYRELEEELSVLPLAFIIREFYNSFTGKTPHSNNDLEAKVYFGFIMSSFKFSNEIDKAEYTKDFEKYNLSKITSEIINSLKRDEYLK